MTIKEVAALTNISAHTIRFYEKTGLFPKVKRTKNGIREFTHSDVEFLIFITTLKKTGMSLEDILEFTKDGCILERLESGVMPQEPVNNRLFILKEHRNKLLEQQRSIQLFINAVTQKISFYEKYIANSTNNETEGFSNAAK